MALTNFKKPFQSLTINASTLAVGASLLQVFGINLMPDIIPHATAIVTGVASAVAIYGRIRAKTLIA